MRTFVLLYHDGTKKDVEADRYSIAGNEVFFFVNEKMTEHVNKDDLTMIDEKENESPKAKRKGGGPDL